MAIEANTPIPTPLGWKAAHEVQKGDYLFDQLGNQVEVKTIQEYIPTSCFQVDLDDGLQIIGDKHLTLRLQDRHWRNKLSARGKTKMRLITKSAEELAEPDALMDGKRMQFSLPACMPVQYPSKDLPVPPYIFAVWLACRTPLGRMWVRSRPIEKMKRIFRGYGYAIVTRRHRNGLMLFDIRPSVKDSFLFADAPIPTNIPLGYIESSIDQRLELIEGFIDAGKIKFNRYKNNYTVRDADYRFMRALQAIIESLGMKTVLHTPTKGLVYTLNFKKHDKNTVVFGKMRRYVTSVTKIATKKCVHIDTGTQFLVGEGYLAVC